jgi:YVTN family beta-propeller protein
MTRSFWPLSAVLFAALAPGASTGHGIPRPDDPRLYVANQEVATVSVIDARTNTLLETVDLQQLGFSAKSKPHDTAVEADGSYWYLTLIGDGWVVKFDRADHVVGKARFEAPGLVSLDPTSDRLYVGRSMAAVNPPQRIGIIKRSDMSIEEVEVFFPRPHAIVADPRGRYVFVGSLGANQIATVDAESQQAVMTAVPGDTIHTLVQFAISPDGTRLVATAQMTDKLLVYDSSDPLKLRLLTTLDVNAWPWHPAFTPDGKEVWFGNQRANTVTVVDAGTWTVAGVVRGAGLAEPHGIAISTDGKTVYVSSHNLQGSYTPAHPRTPNGTGTVVAIDRATRMITTVIETDRYAACMSIGGGH